MSPPPNGQDAPTQGTPQPTFTPDHATGMYAVGERVGWTVTLPTGIAPNTRYPYTVRRNGGDSVAAGVLAPAHGRARIETSLAEPGMLVVEVRPPAPDSTVGARSTGGPGRVLLGAAVAPTAIRPAAPKPADFDAFWAAPLAQLAPLAAVPIAPLVRAGESGRPSVTYATVRLNNIDRERHRACLPRCERRARVTWSGAVGRVSVP